jgi:hypothetical protein
MSRLLHFLDNRLTDGGEVVSLMRWLPFTIRKIPRTSFCQRLGQPQSHSAAGKIRTIEKTNDIRNRTRDLLACSIVPQPTTLSHAPLNIDTLPNIKYAVQNVLLLKMNM